MRICELEVAIGAYNYNDKIEQKGYKVNTILFIIDARS